MQSITREQLLQHLIQTAATSRQRQLVAIAGAPGSGKSTLAEWLVAEIDKSLEPDIAAVVPQDGFHYDNTILDRRDRLAAKGAPDTFDTEGFRALLTRLKAEATVVIPLFDRTLDVARNAARLIDSSHRLLLVEGNYLLLQNHPQWRQLKPLFDLTVFLETPVQELRRRLQLRWTDLGLNPEKAREKVEGNDLVNAETVIRYSARSDYVLRFKEIDVASHS